VNEFQNWTLAVKEVRAMLKPKTEWEALTAGSRRDYEQKFAALGDRLPVEVAQCKKTYYTMRAAYLHCQTRAIRDNLNTLDKWLKAQGGVDALKTRTSDYFAQVKALGLDKQFSDYKAVSTAAPFVGSSRGVIQPSHGKRAVGRLPVDWKTKLVGGVPKSSKYRAHVAAMALCGCRPSEFEGHGVIVEKVDEDTYRFKVFGKKTGQRQKNGKTFTTGQTERVITVSRTDTLDKLGQVNPEFIVLDRALKGKTYVELNAKAVAIRDAVLRASEKAFPELKNKPTAYSFRHAFASELKAANGLDSVETAAALGHASTKTQGCYGYGLSGGRGGYTRKATAKDAIRTPQLSRVEALKKAQTRKAKPTTGKAAMPSPATPKAPMPAPRHLHKPMPSWVR
jgi:integrase